MTRLIGGCLVGLLAIALPARAQELAGTWRQETEGIGESHWILRPAGEGVSKATEIGLGSATGKAFLNKDQLVIQFKAGDARGVYEWSLKGKTGQGRLYFTKWPGIEGGTLGEVDGKQVLIFASSNVRFIGNEAVGLWQMNTPGVGESKLYVTETAGKLRAEEFGLGFAKGKTATCQDGHLVIPFEAGKDLAGYWELDLTPDHTRGTGKIVYTRYKKEFGYGEETEIAGRKVRVSNGLTVERLSAGGFGDDWTIECIPSHRITQVFEAEYTFPDYESTRWFIARGHPQEVPWMKDVKAKMELLTSDGWKPFEVKREKSLLKQRIFCIDYPHEDPILKRGFKVRRTVTATVCEQKLKKGFPETPVPPLTAEEKTNYLRANYYCDFHNADVKKWMDDHKMWRNKGEKPMDFALRVRWELIDHIPYNPENGIPWVCSQILKQGSGECFCHAVVATSILRANKIPARVNGGQWANDENSKGGHCWMEVFLDGVGWVTCDSIYGRVGDKEGEFIVGAADSNVVYDAGPFGKQTTPIDPWLAYWAQGKGKMEEGYKEAITYKVLKRFR